MVGFFLAKYFYYTAILDKYDLDYLINKTIFQQKHAPDAGLIVEPADLPPSTGLKASPPKNTEETMAYINQKTTVHITHTVS